jgi:carboxymethylenebutenolidase
MGLGYAAAAAPLMAQTAIATPADGLDAGEVSFTVGGFQVPAYRAAPAGKTGLPVVLVIQEIFGVHEYIADTCRRFAKAGYLAIAPELYARQGDPAMYGEMAKLMAEVVSKVPDAQVMADLDGAVQWAGANGGDAARRWASPAFAGAAASPGCMPRTARSRRAWPGMAAWWGRRAT